MLRHQPDTYIETYGMYTLICCEFWYFFAHSYVFVRAPIAQTPRRSTEKEGRPDTAYQSSFVEIRDLGAIRTVCRAWRALKAFFPAGGGVDIRRFPGFLCEAFFVFSTDVPIYCSAWE